MIQQIIEAIVNLYPPTIMYLGSGGPTPLPAAISKAVQSILNLLPPGVAWNRSDESSMYKLVLSMAYEMSRIDQATFDLIVESDPRTTTDWIDDWERVLSLPGDCVGLAETLAERRAAVVAKLISRTSQTKAYYVSLAASLGYTITVDDVVDGYDAFRCEDRCESLVGGVEWRSVFTVIAPNNVSGNALLECVITDNKPAHAHVFFEYT